MLCVSNVALPDWPLHQARDVDVEDEAIRGLLRAGFITPLVRRPEAPPKLPAAVEAPLAPQEPKAADAPAQPSQDSRKQTTRGKRAGP